MSHINISTEIVIIIYIYGWCVQKGADFGSSWTGCSMIEEYHVRVGGLDTYRVPPVPSQMYKPLQ